MDTHYNFIIVASSFVADTVINFFLNNHIFTVSGFLELSLSVALFSVSLNLTTNSSDFPGLIEFFMLNYRFPLNFDIFFRPFDRQMFLCILSISLNLS
jgi:hypothetical protein